MNLTAIYTRHKIPTTYWKQFSDLVLRGKRPCESFRQRLRSGNFKAALDEILLALSAPYMHLFS